MSKRRSEQEQDTGMSWDLSGLADWTADLTPLDLSGLGIAPAELESGYNDRQEAAGRKAWELEELNQRRSKDRSKEKVKSKAPWKP